MFLVQVVHLVRGVGTRSVAVLPILLHVVHRLVLVRLGKVVHLLLLLTALRSRHVRLPVVSWRSSASALRYWHIVLGKLKSFLASGLLLSKRYLPTLLLLRQLHGIHLFQIIGVLLLYLLFPARYFPFFTSNIGPKTAHFRVLLGDLQLVVVFNVILLVLYVSAAAGNNALRVVMLLRDGLQAASGTVLLVGGVAHLGGDACELSVPALGRVLVEVHLLTLVQVVGVAHVAESGDKARLAYVHSAVHDLRGRWYLILTDRHSHLEHLLLLLYELHLLLHQIQL